MKTKNHIFNTFLDKLAKLLETTEFQKYVDLTVEEIQIKF